MVAVLGPKYCTSSTRVCSVSMLIWRSAAVFETLNQRIFGNITLKADVIPQLESAWRACSPYRGSPYKQYRCAGVFSVLPRFQSIVCMPLYLWASSPKATSSSPFQSHDPYGHQCASPHTCTCTHYTTVHYALYIDIIIQIYSCTQIHVHPPAAPYCRPGLAFLATHTFSLRIRNLDLRPRRRCQSHGSGRAAWMQITATVGALKMATNMRVPYS